MNWIELCVILLINFCSVLAQHDGERIYFPGEHHGISEKIIPQHSENIASKIIEEEKIAAPNFVSDFSSKIIEEEKIAAPNFDSDFSSKIIVEEEIAAPNFDSDFFCGYPYKLGVFHGRLSNNETRVPLYHLNKTAEKLSEEGFQISDETIWNEDALYNFTFTNGTFTEKIGYEVIIGVAPTGGRPASYIRAYYMAQIGEKIDDKITWLCDGVLINRQWILTAAHCFTFPGIKPNIVRLGDYNLTEPPEAGINYRGKFIEDYEIEDIIPFPEFKIEERYHDVVLLKIPRKIPKIPASINPICLPWGNQTNRNLVGSDVILTGWGATSFGLPKTESLIEVDLKVFNTSICDEAYSKLPGNRAKYPSGMSDENILCVGWEEGGKDACKGDSGGPIVYDIRGDGRDYIILAGIVSGGFGCGLKEYPGIYIPINKPKYLRWIKEIAFKEYS